MQQTEDNPMSPAPLRPLLAACALASAVTAPRAAAAAAPGKQPANGARHLSYLMLVNKEQQTAPEYKGHSRGKALPGRKLNEKLRELGFETREVAAFSPALDMAYLKQFNVVVLGGGGEGNQHALFSELSRSTAELVLEYVKQGGGLLLFRNPGWQFGRDIEEYNQWLAPTGIEILPEQMIDPENRIELDSNAALFWTDKIAEHEVTKGVEGVFYPDIFSGYGKYTDFASPIRASADWQVLLYGKKTARSLATKKGGAPPPPAKGTYESCPPFLAVREFGKGRIAVLPIAASCLWQDGFHILWGGGFVMEGQSKGMTGSGARLMTNLFRYLSEPSRDAFGNFPEMQAVHIGDPGNALGLQSLHDIALGNNVTSQADGRAPDGRESTSKFMAFHTQDFVL